MKDMGEAEYILGVKIYRDRSKKLLSLSQETYIKRIIEQFRMPNANPVDTMDNSFVLSKELCPKTEEERNVWLRFRMLALESLRLIGYSDADGLANRDECKSTSGYAFLLGYAAVSWCSKK
ncbi:UNVERIFIED_CONTAM: hypothetical protein Sradi_5241300 [Sesamum radiatum]|uniref:Retrovirus-related Pol polyprotein from transposon TNT 1-94 n=1 Tax=Sesamum radiatum TaxID=300843 RepID=A0AAW2LM71_SESRA